MLTCTPSKPIFFASATDSIFTVCRKFQSVTPILNFTPFCAAYAMSCLCESAATVVTATDCKKRRLEIVIEWTRTCIMVAIWLRCAFSVDTAAHSVCQAPLNCQCVGTEGSKIEYCLGPSSLGASDLRME